MGSFDKYKYITTNTLSCEISSWQSPAVVVAQLSLTNQKSLHVCMRKSLVKMLQSYFTSFYLNNLSQSCSLNYGYSTVIFVRVCSEFCNHLTLKLWYLWYDRVMDVFTYIWELHYLSSSESSSLYAFAKIILSLKSLKRV